AEALRMALARPDLIILDVKLPDIDGFEVCRRIKSDPATRGVPVLHVSNTFVDIDDKVQGLESGADGYLTSVAEPLELLATVRSLLRARRAEDAAELSARQWQTTFDTISDGLMLLDGGGRVVQVNRTLERMLARSWSELVGHDVPAILGGDERARALFERMVESGERSSRDVELGPLWLRVSMDPIRDASGAVRGALCLVADITGLKRLEMQLLGQARRLQEDDRRKDEFLAMLGHELRNPLAPLSHALELIATPELSPDLATEALEIARRQVRHMARLVEDLLDLSRITRGTIELRRQPVEFRPIVAHAIESSRPQMEARRHEFVATLCPDALPMDGDPTRLEQIVTNLLNNAAKYTEPGGRVAVDLARQGGEAVLIVRDTGIGITPEMQRCIFDLFVQADRALDRSQGGLGIGLTLVRRLTELHGGTIDVSSDGPGHGSEFVVRLPVQAEAPAASVARSPDEAPAPPPLRRVLLVDDNNDSVKTLSMVLRLRGFDSRHALDGPRAIAITADWRPHAVVLDIGLPGMDGYQVAARIREQAGDDCPTLVALTGYGGAEARRQALEAGFHHHFIKPVNLDELFLVLAASAPRGAPGG
ncbi:MAG: PAS domain-containing hybrid sensor histidine kinase/response regulator, partial [Isosphaeraceae bacterium]